MSLGSIFFVLWSAHDHNKSSPVNKKKLIQNNAGSFFIGHDFEGFRSKYLSKNWLQAFAKIKQRSADFK